MTENFTNEWKAEEEKALRKVDGERIEPAAPNSSEVHKPGSKQEGHTEEFEQQFIRTGWEPDASPNPASPYNWAPSKELPVAPADEPPVNQPVEPFEIGNSISSPEPHGTPEWEQNIWPTDDSKRPLPDASHQDGATRIINAREAEAPPPSESMTASEWAGFIRCAHPGVDTVIEAETVAGRKAPPSPHSARPAVRPESQWPLAIGLGLLCLMAAFMVVYVLSLRR